MDLTGYDAYMSGKLIPYELPDEMLEKTEACLKMHPVAAMRKTGKW
jgi:hypothetical protein